MKLNGINKLFLLFFLAGLSIILFWRNNMQAAELYDKIMLSARQGDWKMCFLDSDESGSNAIKMHHFSTGETTTVYKYPVTNQVYIPPMISNRGDKIAFWMVDGSRQPSLYVIQSDGSGLKKITTMLGGHGIAWSPDDIYIAFVGYPSERDAVEKNGSLFIANIQTNEIKQILKNCVDGISSQSWIPDGKRLVYGKKNKIICYDLTTGNSEVITDVDMYACSPLSDSVVYLRGYDLATTTLDGKKKEILFRSKEITYPPFCWLPDGKHILFGKYIGQSPEAGTPFVMDILTKKEEEMPDFSWIFSSWAK